MWQNSKLLTLQADENKFITTQNATNDIYLHKRYDPAFILSDDFLESFPCEK